MLLTFFHCKRSAAMMENGMATESLWGEFLTLVYGREAIEDQGKQPMRSTIDGAMDEFPTPDSLLFKSLGIIDSAGIERQCSKRGVESEH